MSSLQLTFSEVYIKVSEFLGHGSSPSGTILTDVKNITYRGYRRFLMPIDPKSGVLHTWSFLRQTAVLTTTADKWEYEMPTDFSYPGHSFKFSTQKTPPAMRSVGQIMTMRSSNTSSSYPQFFAIRAGKYHKDTGQRYEAIFQPPPDGVYTFVYDYIMEPEKPTETGDYFVGGSVASECIMQCALAVAEFQEDETAGIQGAKADELLTALIIHDQKIAPDTVGMNDGIYSYDPVTLARESRWIDAPTEAYGVS